MTADLNIDALVELFRAVVQNEDAITREEQARAVARLDELARESEAEAAKARADWIEFPGECDEHEDHCIPRHYAREAALFRLLAAHLRDPGVLLLSERSAA